MFDESLVKGAVQIANARIKKRFPLMEDPIKEYMAFEILDALKELLEKLNESNLHSG